MRKIGGNRKLLRGLFLLLLLDTVMCAPMTTYEQEELKRELSIQTDQFFNGRLHCPPYVADEVKNCVMVESNKEDAEVCTILKSVWGCQRDGLLKCKEGPEVWKLSAPVLDSVAKSLGCPEIQINHVTAVKPAPTTAKSSEGNSHILFFGILVVAFVCLGFGYYFGVAKKKRSASNF